MQKLHLPKNYNDKLSVSIDNNFMSNIPDIVSEHDNNFTIVTDKTISEYIPKNIIQTTNSLILENNPKPTIENVQKIQNHSDDSRLIVGIGSGTINDLCKYASYLSAKPYIIFATATSMNGYASPTASIIYNNIKTSKQAQMPKAIYADMDILTQAPPDLMFAGFGDSICRSTCRADWLLSHKLLNTEYNEEIFLILKSSKKILLENISDLRKKSPEAINILFYHLILSGICMDIASGSYPASQGEHIISHMIDLYLDHKNLHGTQIGMTTITSSRLQEKILSLENAPELSIPKFPEIDIKKTFGNNNLEKYKKIYATKTNNVKDLNKKLSNIWKTLQKEIMQDYLSTTKILLSMSLLNMPSTPDRCGLDNAIYNKIVKLSYTTRERFTFLDIAAMTSIYPNI